MAVPQTASTSADLAEGATRTIQLGEDEVLVTRAEGQYHAVSAKCPHYGAPLEQGVLNGHRLVCPWHHACFDVRDGHLLEPPALDGLRGYPVRLEGGQLVVGQPAVQASPARPTGSDSRTFAILGAGAAGVAAAEALREHGFAGRVVLISAEPVLPYDRPNLSKDYLAGKAEPDWLPLRSGEDYAARGIELWRGRRVTRVLAPERTLEFSDGSRLEAEALLLAPGAVPRNLEVPGHDLAGVHLLRSQADAEELVSGLEEGAHAVVVGASFIGMEAAASLRARHLEVTVVGPEAVPFARVFGERVGRWLQEEHERQGVRFCLKRQVTSFEGDERVRAVILEDGTRLQADIVLVGIGVQPATSVIEGLRLNRDGGIPVGSQLRAAEGVFAAGDVASFPGARPGESLRVEHWRVAQQHGRTAAANMLGEGRDYTAVPFFWSNQFDLKLRYVGHAQDAENVRFRGQPGEGPFLAFYGREGAVEAVLGVGRDREMAAAEELLRLHCMPSMKEIATSEQDLASVLAGEEARA
jgi:NADPH-dependent 2,4-dienoyl-CoA reductase/sulfur reductase-like enzyme/nitrite reductase/ring-hydroxylating ferredoxin subunit